MKLKRYFVEGLAHASYLVGSNGEAAVVDPRRDVDEYLADAEAWDCRIVAVLNTHPHADFASGFPELAQRTGARVHASHLAPAKYERVPAHEGMRLRVGSVEIEVLETPGHSPDSLSFVVHEAGEPVAIFTGDLLFVNDVGRPDLRDADSDPRQLADALYDSLFHKILSLPEQVRVYPAHGAGSLCGRALGSAPFTTVGQERKGNWAAQVRDRGEFVRRMLAQLPARPAYFSYDVELNLRGARPYSQLSLLRALTETETKEAAASGAVVIDTRSAPLFGAGHFANSLNIGIGSAMFSTWAGFLVPGDSAIVLVANDAKSAANARLELARIGFDNVIGWVAADSLRDLRQLSQLSVCDLKAALRLGIEPLVVDVRTPAEWNSGHIASAQHLPLPAIRHDMDQVPRNKPVAVICGSGYRSSLAASLLLRSGFSQVTNVMGGMGAFGTSNCIEWQPSDLVFAGEGI